MAARRSMSPNMRPTTSAARRPAGSSRRPRSGCSLRLLVILATRTGVGEDGVRRLGLAHPVPGLGRPAGHLGLDARQARRKPGTSPSCARKARSPRRRCARPSATAKNLKQVLIAFFGIMCAQGAVWYFTFFYIQVFLEKSLGRAGRDQGPAADRDDRRQRAALRLFRLAQRPHRPQAGDARRHAAGAGRSISPASHWIAAGRQPGAGRGAAARRRSIVETDPATCSVQFDPVGTAKFVSACDIAKSALVAKRHLLHDARLGRRADPRSSSAPSRSPIAGGEGLAGADLKALKADDRRRDRRRAGRRRLSQARRPGAGEHAAADRRPAAVRRRRDRALRAAGGGAGRDVPDPHPLHGDVAALPCRHRLGRRLPAGHQLRPRRDHRQYLCRPVVPGRLHRACRWSSRCCSSRKRAASRSRNV